MSSPQSPIFFWRETEPDHGFLCQWFSAPFEAEATPGDGNRIYYPTAEHYMMHQKAEMYCDQDIVAKILATKNPAEAKYLARTINMSVDKGKRWEQQKYDVAERGTFFKFSQNLELKRRLLETGERELVEASPSDRVWGVGFSADIAERHRESWGMNLLGQALMSVREQLREEKQGDNG